MPLGPHLGLDGRLVRQLLVQLQVQLLARDLGRKLTQRRVRHLVFRIMPRAGRRVLGKPALHIGDPVAFQGRDHKGGFELRLCVGGLRQRQQVRFRDQVYLVQKQNFRLPHLGELAEDRFGLVIEPSLGVDQQARRCRHRAPGPRGRHHGAVEPAARRENPRRIDEHKLRLARDRDAAHQRARGLHLRRDDRDLAAGQRVGQRRLAGVRRADQRDEAAARLPVFQPSLRSACTPSRSSMAAAAACSAARLDRPMPSAGSRSGNPTVTAKLGIVMRPLALDLA